MDKSKLHISVAMCTYNGSQFLPEQLASIARQTRMPDELVVCDDGSVDCTIEILRAFANSVSFPVRIFCNDTNLGSTKNFEKAIGLCVGDLIALCDQDDIWMPEKLAYQVQMMESDSELGGVFSDAELVNDQSRLLGTRLWDGFRFTPREQKRFRNGEEIPVLLRWNVVTGATLIFRADLRQKFAPIPTCWHQDGWITWMIVLYSKLRFIEEPLIHYRIHANQQVGVEIGELSRKLSRWQRLKRGKLEERANQLSTAKEIMELTRRLDDKKDPKGLKVIPALRLKAQFLTDRGMPYKSKLFRIKTILRHTNDYHRFDVGWKCLLRDIIISFV